MTTQLDIRKNAPADDPDGWSPEQAQMEQDWAAAMHGGELSELKYDPDQPRNDQGRWTSAGDGAAKLSDSEINALEHYTGAGFDAMNRALRGQPLPDERFMDASGWPGGKLQIEVEADRLDAAIAKSVLPEDKVLYRGGSMHLLSSEPGFTFRDNGFVSTSETQSTAEDFTVQALQSGHKQAVVVAIHAPKGAHALPVGEHTKVAESEWILPRGSSFKVTGTESDRNAPRPMTMIHVDLVPEAKKEWDESLHPRDDQGRFTDSGGDTEAPPTRELGTVAFGYSGEVVPGNTRVIWRNDTPKAVIDNVKDGLKFLRQKGDMRIGNVVIDPTEFEKGSKVAAVTYGWGDSEKTEVRVNPEVYQSLTENPTPGWMSSDDPKAVIVHENGHIVHRGQMTGKWDTHGRDLDPIQTKAAATVSQYATANSGEFMAEAYAAKMLGKGLSPSAQKLYDAIQARPVGGTVEGFDVHDHAAGEKAL